eukprot:2390828-Pyramimonas_sp.AAC.1
MPIPSTPMPIPRAAPLRSGEAVLQVLVGRAGGAGSRVPRGDAKGGVRADARHLHRRRRHVVRR